MNVICMVSIDVNIPDTTSDADFENAVTDELDKVITVAYELVDYEPCSVFNG